MKKNTIEILKNTNRILEKLSQSKTNMNADMLSFYSSQMNSIITDPVFMNVSIEDKIIHRGYSVFETTKMFGNKIFNFQSHLNRLFKSLEYVTLKPRYTKDELEDIILQTASVAREIEPKENLELRFFYSAGLGNFSIQENPDLHTFYVITFRDKNHRPLDGVKEYMVDKGALLKNSSKAKTTNYLHNCMINKYSRDKGGYLGIISDSEGNLLESPISNIAFVNKDMEFIVPSYDKTLKGTTVELCLDYVEKTLQKTDLIKRISRVDTNIEDIRSGKILEAMFIGGDYLIPILEVEDIKISEKPGLISLTLQKYLDSNRITDTKEVIISKI